MDDHDRLERMREKARMAWLRKARSCPEIERTRREMAKELNKPTERPDASLGITRRTFLHKSLLAGAAAGAATYGWFPLFNTLDVAFGAQGFKFAWISDNHLYPKDVNTRFVEKAVRAVKEVRALSPPADFLIHGGDLAQLGDPVELDLGNEILKEVTIKKVFIPGEHDWYLDMGVKWQKLFGKATWTFDHKGVRFIGLDTVSRGPDYWSVKKMTPKERMGHMATLDGSVAGAWAGVGRDQLQWLDTTLASWPKDRPVVIFTHNPLYEYYPPWNFWVRDWREVHEILRPYTNVTNIHGHTHQVLYNEIGKMRSIGMLATSWPWPYAPEGVPTLTKPMVRADPGDHFDGVGWSKLTMAAAEGIENEYVMWRQDVFAEAAVDSGTGDNVNQILSPRIADREWPYYGAYK
jgi:calcineurin-like phosphoesterase family protein